MQHLQPNTTLQSGKYRIERVLGQGGFGNTYMATNTAFDDHVAIKEFFMQGINGRDENSGSITIGIESNTQQFEEQREKFKKEARRLRKLKNEHIVKVHDLFEENGTAYYVMDFIDGESLAEKMKKTGQPYTESEVRSILSQILEALKDVHQNEIWHLDLKPGNIMIDKNGTAYLIDFGASKQIRANGSMTTSTALCYTPGYAPNEQIGQMYDRFGPWTDIYALGATIYNLLTNKKPPMAIDIEEDEDDAFEFPTTVSDEMRKLVVWMMKTKRKSRPQNVDEILVLFSNKATQPELSKREEARIKSPYTINSEDTILENIHANEDNADSDFVNLGLSVRWASNNLNVDQIGAYFKGVVINNLKEWDSIPQDFGGTSYDPASIASNYKLRMPTRNEWEELINKCKWEWGKKGNIPGYTIIGTNGNKIFLPLVGGYWSCTIKASDVLMSTYHLQFNSEKVEITSSAYTILRCIRPVLKE